MSLALASGGFSFFLLISATQISIPGSGNLENDTVAGTELVVDGIPINQADGEAYLQDLDLNSVKFVEVYRGADAFRFGGITLGGSINFITYTGRDLPSPFNIRSRNRLSLNQWRKNGTAIGPIFA